MGEFLQQPGQAQTQPLGAQMGEAERKLALLMRVLTDPELTKQRQASGDPWTFTAPNASFPNIKLFQNQDALMKDFIASRPDPALYGAFADSLKKGGGLTPMGHFDSTTSMIRAPYVPDAIEHELGHFFYPEFIHPPGETLEEYRARRAKELETRKNK